MQETASYRLINMSTSSTNSGGGGGSGGNVEVEAWLGAAAVMAQFEGAWGDGCGWKLLIMSTVVPVDLHMNNPQGWWRATRPRRRARPSR